MNLNVMQGCANPSVNNIELVVEELSSTELVVRAGTFKVSGVDYAFAEDQVYALVNDPPVRVWVTGCLVRNESGDAQLLVDEVYDNGEDAPYSFKGSPYQLLNHLFVFEIPAHGGTLTDLDVTAFLVVPTQVE
jgi:hypothetical protein